MMKFTDSRGFSLIESFIALAIGAFFLTSVTATWYASTTMWKEESVRNEMRLDIEKSMERIKQDVRLSDSNGILFYPVGQSTYTAVSIPARSVDGNGFYAFSGGLIDWNRTICYHVYTSGAKSELRRTIYPTYNASAVARQTQLNTLAVTGNDTNGTTTVLMAADTLTMEISPQSATFEGYAPSVSHSGDTNFGSLQLSSGTHTIKFEVTGKNASSSGYGMGIDSITLSPSGGPQEAEALTVSARVGAAESVQDMTASGPSWGGGQHVHFPAGATGSYISFNTNYDQWLESNFSSMTYSNAQKTSGADPELRIQTREDQSLTPAWLASTVTSNGNQTQEAGVGPASIRIPINAGDIQRSGVMMRIRFRAGTAGGLTINSAYFGPSAVYPNMLSLTQLYFDDGSVANSAQDPDGATANPGTATSVAIGADCHAWSNWFPYTVMTGGATSYMVSLSVTTTGNTGTVWTESPAVGNYSYRTTAAADAATLSWSLLTVTTSPNLFAVEEISTWQNTATATSQVYDTRLSAPAYNQLTWVPTVVGASTITMKVRSSASSTMSGATDWSLLPTYLVSPASIVSLTNARYVQFQATLTSASPYVAYPALDNVKIDWPGQTALVEISGAYTKRPSYGQFKVQVDGSGLVKALELKLTATGTQRGKTVSYSLNTEQDPMNSGR